MRSPSPAPEAAWLFEQTFDARPIVAASAPGRVNLIGEHLDYNGGPVLPFALERRTAVAAAAAPDWRFVSTSENGTRRRALDDPMGGEWSDYLIGVVRELSCIDAAPRGARVAVASSVPRGAGLSSSAALTVAAVRALSALAGRRLPPARIAEIAYRAEHHQVGVKCGRMDQTVAAHARAGTALLFDTAAGTLMHVPLPGTVWVIETGVSHRLIGGELNARRRECEAALAECRRVQPGLRHLAELGRAELASFQQVLSPTLFRRVRHVVTETVRTHAAAEALAAGDSPRVGHLLLEGHESLRRDFESTVPEADLCVEAAVEHGAWGARLTGAGWGGAVIVLVAPERARAVICGVEAAFRRNYERSPVAWSTRAGSGVRSEPIRA